jgi:hypothetical protein
LQSEVERIQANHDKWAVKIEQFKNMQKHNENQNYKTGREQTQAIREYLENKRRLEKLKHSESMQDQNGKEGNSLELPSPSNRNNAMRFTWKGIRSDRFGVTKRTSIPTPGLNKAGITNGFSASAYKFSAEDDDVVYFKMTKYEDKMKAHEDRLASEHKKIIEKCQNHSMHVDSTKSNFEELLKKRYEDSFTKTVTKSLKTKTQVEKRDKFVTETVVESLQEKHRQNLERLRR